MGHSLSSRSRSGAVNLYRTGEADGSTGSTRFLLLSWERRFRTRPWCLPVLEAICLAVAGAVCRHMRMACAVVSLPRRFASLHAEVECASYSHLATSSGGASR